MNENTAWTFWIYFSVQSIEMRILCDTKTLDSSGHIFQAHVVRAHGHHMTLELVK
jgi:hypothetical protein